MNQSLRILFLSAEVAPFAKRGGLADIAGSLPTALAAMGHDVKVIMPAYREIEDGYPDVVSLDRPLHVPLRGSFFPFGAFEGRLRHSGVPIYFVAERNLFYRPNIYGYDDDPYRFGFFSRAALALCQAIDWQPDIVHANDWHTAAAVMWLATNGHYDPFFGRTRTVYTIHNLAYQGRAGWDLADYLGIWTHRLREESYGEINMMARGIYHADRVTTVSPTYTNEIRTPEGGAGMHELLRHRGAAVSGILNGLDYQEWNPQTDPRLPANYSADDVQEKKRVRQALQEQLGLPVRDVPMISMISRLDWQKGLDISGHVMHRLMSGEIGEVQLVVLGTGEPAYESMLHHLAGYHRAKMRAIIEFRAELAALIYAGSDLFLMPSRFEPCGLSQLIAMRYGTLPVARATGGLADTVWQDQTGFLFGAYSADAFWGALRHALDTYHNRPDQWLAMQRAAMTQDFSWSRSAELYEQLYKQLHT